MALFLAAAVAVAGTGGVMAAMIGHDRVTAAYPGFHVVKGDMTALAANGPDRKMQGGYGRQDAIVIRRVTTLAADQTHHFELSDALRIAVKYERRGGFKEIAKLQPFANERKLTVCGRPAFGFTRIEEITIPIYDAPSISWTEFVTFVTVLVGRDVWQAEYTRLYEPHLQHDAGRLIAFTSQFCVQPNY